MRRPRIRKNCQADGQSPARRHRYDHAVSDPKPQADATLNTYHARVLRVQLHIQAHLDASLSVDELASLAHFSPYHFHRIFRGLVGESLMAYVRRLRLERAAHELTLTPHSVKQIASRAGFRNHESFTRSFLGHFGISPSAFRTQQPRWLGARPRRARGDHDRCTR